MIVEEITAQTAADWMTTLYRFIEAVGSDGGHLTPLRNCMHKLARDKPDVAILMLDDIEATGSALLAQLLVGLDEAGRNDAVSAHLDAWLARGAQLPGIGDYLRCGPRLIPSGLRLMLRAPSQMKTNSRSSLARRRPPSGMIATPTRFLLSAG
ncbi:hypothetical protein GCM10020258_52070 [Sphingomonas yabuuchiae]